MIKKATNTPQSIIRHVIQVLQWKLNQGGIPSISSCMRPSLNLIRNGIKSRCDSSLERKKERKKKREKERERERERERVAPNGCAFNGSDTAETFNRAGIQFDSSICLPVALFLRKVAGSNRITRRRHTDSEYMYKKGQKSTEIQKVITAEGGRGGGRGGEDRDGKR